MTPWNPFNALLLRIVALALDAAVDHPDVLITEDQYEELLREVRRRLDTDLSTLPPAYPEALLRAAENSH